jgi:uncharacterized membrane protein YeiH
VGVGPHAHRSAYGRPAQRSARGERMMHDLQLTSTTLIKTLDLIGTFVFAISGAALGVRNRLDLFGVAVLAFVAGNAGGMMRDVLIGAVPPAAISDWRYVSVSIMAAAVTVWWFHGVRQLRGTILLFDAAGLGMFAVSGTQKALGYGVNPLLAALLGMLTGIGGGMIRDVLVNDIPIVLRGDVYAVAALAAAALVTAGHLLRLEPTVTTVSGAILCFVIRLVAIRRGWNLP